MHTVGFNIELYTDSNEIPTKVSNAISELLKQFPIDRFEVINIHDGHDPNFITRFFVDALKDLRKDLLIHSHIQDGLPTWHPLAYKSIYCDKCLDMVHAFNNECMQTWFETDEGNYCTKCVKISDRMQVLEFNEKQVG